jgi:hypothetical protein
MVFTLLKIIIVNQHEKSNTNLKYGFLYNHYATYSDTKTQSAVLRFRSGMHSSTEQGYGICRFADTANTVHALRGLQMVEVCFRGQTLNRLDQEVKL